MTSNTDNKINNKNFFDIKIWSKKLIINNLIGLLMTIICVVAICLTHKQNSKIWIVFWIEIIGNFSNFIKEQTVDKIQQSNLYWLAILGFLALIIVFITQIYKYYSCYVLFQNKSVIKKWIWKKIWYEAWINLLGPTFTYKYLINPYTKQKNKIEKKKFYIDEIKPPNYSKTVYQLIDVDFCYLNQKKSQNLKNFFHLNAEYKYQLKNINIKIDQGTFTTILGCNGCGKSTLMKLLCNYCKPSNGVIYFFSHKLNSLKVKDLAKLIAFVPQSVPDIYDLTVYDYVSYGRSPHQKGFNILNCIDEECIKLNLNLVNLWEKRNKYLHQLSGGEKQKILIVQALTQNTPILLLDEPVTYLDWKAQIEIIKILKQLQLKGKTIITILHDVNQAIKYSDNLILMCNNGVIAQGKPNKVITKEILEKLLHSNVMVYKKNGQLFFKKILIDK